jgi:hypothetical protein
MAEKHLATYLNDHLAGSVTGLQLMEYLEAEHGGTNVAEVIAQVRAEIEEEQKELEALIERLQFTQHSPRQVMAWLTEKAAQVKLRLDDPADGALRLFETLEAIAIGIQGKGALWRALATASVPGLPVADYERLAQRSEDQHRRVEALRLEAAKVALSGDAVSEGGKHKDEDTNHS